MLYVQKEELSLLKECLVDLEMFASLRVESNFDLHKYWQLLEKRGMMALCVCVCVCARQRERERERVSQHPAAVA